MFINIMLNFIVIPILNAKGSAMVSLFTQAFVATTQIIMVQRIFKFKMIPKLLLTLLLFIAGLVGINLLTLRIPADWRLQFVCMGAASVIWAFAIGLVNIKSLLRVVKNG